MSCDIDGDRSLDRETTFYNTYYKLPNKRVIKLSNEKFEAPEILFSPILIQSEADGIHEMIVKCITECPVDTRKDLYKNIILSGANTMFPGYCSRLEKEIKNVYKRDVLKDTSREIKIDISVIDSPIRQNSVFMGACFIANLYNKEELINYWITKEDWNEVGENIINTKCPNIIQ